MAKNEKLWIPRLASLVVLVIALLALASPTMAKFLLGGLAVIAFISLVSMFEVKKKHEIIKWVLYAVSVVVFIAFVAL